MEIPNTLCSNIYDFAFCPDPCYERLADLADPEDWGPGNRILKNWLFGGFCGRDSGIGPAQRAKTTIWN